jgi:exonuclease SbcD
VVDVETACNEKRVTYEFHKVNARRFLTIMVDIVVEDADPTGTVLKAIAQRHAAIENAVVRVHISLPAALEASIREAEINKALKAAHCAVIAKEVRQEARLRLGELTSQGLSPIEALKRYLETKKVQDARQKVLLEYGEKLIWEAEQRTQDSLEAGK